MNQDTLIRLEKEAEKIVLQIPASLDCDEFTSLFNEKFAELIVRECIECADIVGKANLTSGYPNSTAHHIKQKIKEHFGVEE